MNQITERTERLPMDAVGMSSGSTGSKIAPQSLAEVVKFAEVMCRADIAIPKHLRGNAGACMAVSMQALDWQMNPFAVASKSYNVNGQIAYEAQLIVAVVNTRSGIEGRITYEFEGEGQDRVCIASGKLDGQILSVRSPKLKDIKPQNSPLWKTDPDQQQCYYTGRNWARRFTPEVILGVYDRDEVESFTGPDNAKDITPAKPSLSDRLAQSRSATEKPVEEQEGFQAVIGQQKQESASEDAYESVGDYDDFPGDDTAKDRDEDDGLFNLSERPSEERIVIPDGMVPDVGNDAEYALLQEVAVALIKADSLQAVGTVSERFARQFETASSEVEQAFVSMVSNRRKELRSK